MNYRAILEAAFNFQAPLAPIRIKGVNSPPKLGGEACEDAVRSRRGGSQTVDLQVSASEPPRALALPPS